MVAFARGLAVDDLLFLDRDLSEPGEVDAWIKDTLSGHSVTLVAWEGTSVVGYVSFSRGNVRWTRHVGELPWWWPSRLAASASAG